MNVIALRIFAWGFSADELAAWPLGLLPVPVVQGPFAGPVVVHARAAGSFVAEAEAHLLADGRLAPAVLYAAEDVALEPGVSVDFAAVVERLDANQLAELFGCPERFAILEYVQELPAAFLRRLTRPINEVAARDLPLPVEVKAHLAECSACRAAFDKAASDRQRWRRLVSCPSLAQLHAYSSGVDLPTVAQHVVECPQCQAEVTVLGHKLQPAWLIASFRPSRSLLVSTAENLAAAQRGLLTVVMVGLRLQMQLAGPHTLLRPASNPDIVASVEELLHGGTIKLERPHRDLTIQLMPDGSAIVISALHGEGRVALQAFSVELWSEEELCWSGRSQNGSLMLPLAALEEALAQGTVNLVVRPGE